MKVLERRGWRRRSWAVALFWAVLFGVNAGCLAAEGDGRPNLALPTLGGLQLWTDVAWQDDWRVQRHVWTGHHRLLDPGDVRRAWGTEAACRTELQASVEAGEETLDELVVLVHGLGRSRHSFDSCADAFERAGRKVLAVSYPSTRASLDEHVASLNALLDGLTGVERVSFVTHSLGGRIVLAMLAQPSRWRDEIELGRVVQIAPPNRGSELARRIMDLGWPLSPAGEKTLGGALVPVLPELAATHAATVPEGVEVGVLAGVRGRLRGWNPWLSGDDDGVVTCRETRLDGPHEHRSVRGLHTFLMNDPQVHAAALRFLETGSF